MAQSRNLVDAPALPESTSEEQGVLDLFACRRWCNQEYDALKQRIRTLQPVIEGAREGQAKAYDSECLAGLGAVTDALHELNLVIVNKGLRPWLAAASPLTAYLSSTYVWCGDVVHDLYELAEHRGSASWEEQKRDGADSATAYITEYLEPRFRELNELCGACWLGHPLQWVRAPAERVQSEIVSLNWELSA
jgi:hypothetical protein